MLAVIVSGYENRDGIHELYSDSKFLDNAFEGAIHSPIDFSRSHQCGVDGRDEGVQLMHHVSTAGLDSFFAPLNAIIIFIAFLTSSPCSGITGSEKKHYLAVRLIERREALSKIVNHSF